MTNELIIATIAILILIGWLNILTTRMSEAEEQIKSLRRDTKELMEEQDKRERIKIMEEKIKEAQWLNIPIG